MNMEKGNKEKGDFLSRMSHDIRTPINAIMGMTTIAYMNLDDNERVKDCLEKIAVASEHLMGIVNKVLDMSKIESGNLSLTEEAFSITELMDSLMTIVSSEVSEKHQNISLDVDVVHDLVKGDPVRLQQVLVNILGNAVKFTQDGGIISIKVIEKPVVITGLGYYEFAVEDNGIGMSENFMECIFEPFTREDNAEVAMTEGSGLGMAISQNIIHMMKGDFKVESAEGKGSCFTVSLCLHLQDETENNGEPVSIISGVKLLKEKDFSGYRILLVEDNHLNMEIAGELLATVGIVTDKVYNGYEAVEKIKNTSPGTYNMVLMDIQMPVMDGYEAAEAIRKINREDCAALPIIAMSANAFTDDTVRIINAGMNGHVSKPVEIEKIFKAIETWCSM